MGIEATADEVLKQKAERRAALRAEFWKQTTNPHRHATGEGGHIFDPAIQRYVSTRVSQWDYFKVSGRTSRWGLGLTVIPMFLFGKLVYDERAEREEKIRTGQIAYRDRKFKYI
uniref:NADH dehydrogenase [ubiquinone] 1 beta subcomplex subunit 4 n=1 Tax=Culicoides sonorensis TaxID=179676 RepID=A0A336MY24_CULSO